LALVNAQILAAGKKSSQSKRDSKPSAGFSWRRNGLA